MKKITQILLFSLTLCLSSVFLSADSSKVLTLKGKKGPGQGKTIILVSGDEEYRTEESMPMLAKILSQKHGFTCKVLFAWDKTEKYIDPNNQSGVLGWDHLKDADLMLIGTRFRKPSEKDAQFITDFLSAQIIAELLKTPVISTKNIYRKPKRPSIFTSNTFYKFTNLSQFAKSPS